jgi:hypothetical protein
MIEKEGIRKSDNGLEFDWDSYKQEDIIPLKPIHKQLMTRKVQMFVAYAFYGINEYVRKNPTVSKEDAKDLIDVTRHELKSLSSPIIKENVYRMVDEGLNKFEKYALLSNFTLIISPKSSSPLNDLIMDKIKKRVPSGQLPMIVPNAMVKNAIKNIRVNQALVDKEKSLKTKEMVPAYYKSLMNNPDDLYAVKKVPASYRRYFVDFLKWSDGINPFFISYAAKQGKVLLVDDTVGEGATAQEMVRQLAKYNPNSIQVFSMFLDYGAGYDNLPTPTA